MKINNKSDNSLEYKSDYLEWKSWDVGFGLLPKTEARGFMSEILKLRSTPPSGANVLDIGFGNGSFLKFAKDQQWHVVGVEVNECLVKAGLDCGYNVMHTHNLDNFQDNAFDLVVAFDVLEHLSYDQLLKTFSDIQRVLKDGGSFVARFPNGDSPFGLLNQNSDITHLTAIGTGKIKYLARKSGLILDYIGGESQPIFGVSFLHFTHRLFSEPFKFILNLLVNPIFYPGKRVAFCSLNLVAICRANKIKL